MDQVRAIVNVLWTQRFWVLSLTCLIVGVVCWNMAASNISAEFEGRKSKIDSAFNDVNRIKGESYHPNDDINKGNEEQARQQGVYVLKEWKELYDRQRAEVLFWPPTLGDGFIDHLKEKKFGDKISATMRDRYLNYIETRFDALIEIVKAKKTARRGGGGERGFEMRGEMGGERGGGFNLNLNNPEEDDDYLVQWVDQGKVQQKLSFKKTPNDLQVWVTQEDLWVYESLLHVIAKTNEGRGATRPDNTAVRAIVALEIGGDAANSPKGKVLIPQSAGDESMRDGGFGEFGREGGFDEYGMGGGYEGGYSRGGGEFDRGMGGGEFGGMGMGRGMGEGGGGNLLAMRYLDAEGQPVEAESPETVNEGEFRQLPIRMKLMMDQRWIPRILIECANAALPVKVNQVRINPNKSGTGLGGRGGSRSGLDRSLQGMSSDASLADVEINGVVYIYNEPKSDQLITPAEEGDTLADSGN